MIVYLLWTGSDSDLRLEAVFSTREKAMTFAWRRRFDPVRFRNVVITPREVDNEEVSAGRRGA